MGKLEITKGKWESKNIVAPNGDFYKVTVDKGESICNITTRNGQRAWNNSELIADAGNIYQKCELSPSELLEKNIDLRQSVMAKDALWQVEFKEARKLERALKEIIYQLSDSKDATEIAIKEIAQQALTPRP